MREVLALIALGAGALLVSRSASGAVIDLTTGGGNSGGGFLNDLNEVFKLPALRINNMRNVNPALLKNSNVRAFFMVIRKGEGTLDKNGYRRIFGGQLFTSFAAHPNVLVNKSGYRSTAAGAYQFLKSTWDETARIMGLKDFSPYSQDLGALGRIAARGALEDVVNGRFEIAVKKCAKEWASLPFSPYGQPVQTLAGATSVYLSNGGKFTA